MAVPAYSARFIGAICTESSPGESGLVPEGLLWVVKCVSVITIDATEGFLFLYVPGPNTYISVAEMGETGYPQQVFTQQVLYPGEAMEAQVVDNSGRVSVMVSGYALQIR